MQKKRRNIWPILATVVVLGVVSVIVVSALREAPESAPAAQTVRVERGDIAPTLSASGFTVTSEERDVYPKDSGTVKEVYVHEGEWVRKGQELFRMDSLSVRRQADIAQRAYNAEHLRYDDVIDSTDDDIRIADARSALTKAQVDIDEAREALEDMTVTAPISGTVTVLNARVGDDVQGGGVTSAGSTTTAASGSASSSSSSSTGGSTATSGSGSAPVTISQLGHLIISASVDQADISRLEKGQTADATFDALPGRTFSARLRRIDHLPQQNGNVVTYTVYFTVKKLSSKVALGMSADLDIYAGTRRNVLVVPTAAIVSTGDARAVLRQRPGSTLTETVPVITGETDGEKTEIEDGLSEGDVLVIPQLSQTEGGSSGTGSGTGPASGPGSGGGGFGPPPGGASGRGPGNGGPAPGGGLRLRGGDTVLITHGSA